MPRGPSRRQLILDTALAAFTRKGFDGTSVGEIARAVGVSKSAVSFHFPTKDQLLATLIEPLLSELEALFARHPAPRWPEGSIAVAEEYLDVLVRHREVAVWIDADRSVQTRHTERVNATFENMAESITGPDPDPAAHVRALAAVGGLWRPLRMLDAKALTDHRTELIEAALVSFAPLPARAPQAST